MQNTEQEKHFDEECETEPPVSAGSIAEEMEVLLDDYFVGAFRKEGDGIRYELKNGQKFFISVREE